MPVIEAQCASILVPHDHRHINPDGHTLAAASSDGAVRLWNVTDPAHAMAIGQPLTGLTGTVNAVAFSPDGNTLAAGSAGDDSIRLWNVTSLADAATIGQPLTGATNAVEAANCDRRCCEAGGAH